MTDTYEAELAEIRAKLSTKTGRKQEAQSLLMDGIAKVLGYWEESYAMTAEAMDDAERAEFRELLWKQADRVAKLLGYEEAWGA